MKNAEGRSRLQWLALCLSPHIGAKTLNSLLARFDGDLNAAFAASPRELMAAPGIGPKIAREIAAIDLQRLERQVRQWQAAGIEIATARDEAYPAPLRATDTGPPALFFSRLPPAHTWTGAVAIVGSREPSGEARCIALGLARQLAQRRRAVVSGLALGIDSAAHTGALSAGGCTVAVLGSGILNIFPPANRALAEQISQRGALISEWRPHWGAKAQRLVSRNRIISGLSQAVVVVESDVDGGAMHTARFAAEQGRKIYTFDLPASGNQRLIAEGNTVLRGDDPLRGLPV